MHACTATITKIPSIICAHTINECILPDGCLKNTLAPKNCLLGSRKRLTKCPFSLYCTSCLADLTLRKVSWLVGYRSLTTDLALLVCTVPRARLI